MRREIGKERAMRKGGPGSWRREKRTMGIGEGKVRVAIGKGKDQRVERRGEDQSGGEQERKGDQEREGAMGEGR